MKHFLYFLILLPFQANAFFYEQEDKNLHLATSMALTYTISSTLMLTNPKMSSRKAAIIAAGTTLLMGLAKESFYDDKFDWNDMEANTAGVALGAVPFLIWEF